MPETNTDKRVIILDLDGHLLDSEKIFYQIFCEIIPCARLDDEDFIRKFNSTFVKEGIAYYVQKLMGQPFGKRAKLYNELFSPKEELTEKDAIAIDELSNKLGCFRIDKDALFPFVKEMLIFYRDTPNASVYILSSGQGFKIAENIKTCGLQEIFTMGEGGNVVCSGEGSAFKLENKTQAIKEIARREEVALEQIVFSGDGFSDLEHANKAEVSFIQSVYASNMESSRERVERDRAPALVARNVIELFSKQNALLKTGLSETAEEAFRQREKRTLVEYFNRTNSVSLLALAYANTRQR